MSIRSLQCIVLFMSAIFNWFSIWMIYPLFNMGFSCLLLLLPHCLFSLQFYLYLLYIFQYPDVWCIYIYYFYVLLINWLLYYYINTSLSLLTVLDLKSMLSDTDLTTLIYFDYHFHWHSFSSLHFQPMYSFKDKINFL